MMSEKPANVDEALRMTEELQRKNKVASGEVRFNMRLSPYTLEFSFDDVSLDEKTDERIRQLLERLEPHLRWFLSKFPSQRQLAPSSEKSSQIPKTEPSEGWDALPWKDGKFGQWIFAEEPRAKPLLGMIQSQATGKLDLNDWIYSLSQSRTGRDFINRTKKEATKT